MKYTLSVDVALVHARALEPRTVPVGNLCVGHVGVGYWFNALENV